MSSRLLALGSRDVHYDYYCISSMNCSCMCSLSLVKRYALEPGHVLVPLVPSQGMLLPEEVSI